MKGCLVMLGGSREQDLFFEAIRFAFEVVMLLGHSVSSLKRGDSPRRRVSPRRSPRSIQRAFRSGFRSRVLLVSPEVLALAVSLLACSLQNGCAFGNHCGMAACLLRHTFSQRVFSNEAAASLPACLAFDSLNKCQGVYGCFCFRLDWISSVQHFVRHRCQCQGRVADEDGGRPVRQRPRCCSRVFPGVP